MVTIIIEICENKDLNQTMKPYVRIFEKKFGSKILFFGFVNYHLLFNKLKQYGFTGDCITIQHNIIKNEVKKCIT